MCWNDSAGLECVDCNIRVIGLELINCNQTEREGLVNAVSYSHGNFASLLHPPPPPRLFSLSILTSLRLSLSYCNPTVKTPTLRFAGWIAELIYNILQKPQECIVHACRVISNLRFLVCHLQKSSEFFSLSQVMPRLELSSVSLYIWF